MNNPGAHTLLSRALNRAGRLWRWRTLLQGAVLVLLALVVVGAIAMAVMDLNRFQPDVVGWARMGVYLVVVILGLRYLVVRVPWGRDPRRIAEHLEHRDPSLDALLVTAAEVAVKDPGSPLASRLFHQAVAACDGPAGPTLADRHELRRAGGWLVALALVVAVGIFLATAGWRHGAALLALPWLDARAGMPYAVESVTGNVTLVEGTDLEVVGAARGFEPQSVTLFHRAVGATDWFALAMDRNDDAFAAVLPSLSAPVEYFLEAETVASPIHRVNLQWLPRVKRVDHHYRFPAYTGLEERKVEGGTGIAAVNGTEVEVRVWPEALPASGVLVLDGDRRVPLAREDDVLKAALAVGNATHYRVELRAGDGRLVAVTPDHPVTALRDTAPSVNVVSPSGETRVTAVEEMQIAVRASDDVSLRHVELVMSVNGGPEEVIELAADDGAASMDGRHTVHLEERELTPGDLIAFHARASDGVVARTAVSDIHFMEVRPFDRDFSRGRSGGSQQGGGAEREQNLAAQQRDLVIALFRLARDTERLEDEERADRLGVLSEAQARIRGRVEAIVRRLKGRAMVQSTPGYQVVLEEMPRAATAMLRVEALLAVPDPESGLPPAREALSRLQRADAAFREVQVSAQRGSGGQGRADNQDVSRLFELEIDRFRNRYSQVQRAQAPARQQQVDETIRKLEELARRQRQEVERARRRGAREDLAGSGAPSQQALAREIEEMLRRLERLSRKQPSPAMASARQALEQAANAMRNSAGGAGGEGAARQALDRIREAREALSGDGPAQQARELEQARRMAESLAERQNRVRQRLEAGDVGRGSSDESPAPQTHSADASADASKGQQSADASGASSATGNEGQGEQRSGTEGAGDGAGKTRAAKEAAQGGDEESVADVKRAMEADARRLQESLDRIAGDRSADPQAAQGARRAAGVMREEDVEGRLRRSREELAAGVIDSELEEGLGSALDQVREQVASAAQAAGGGQRQGQGEGPGAPTRNEMRAMMRRLGELRQRLAESTRGDGRGPGGRDAADLQDLSAGLDRLRGPVASNAAPAVELEALIRGVDELAAGNEAGGAAPLLEALDTVESALAKALVDAERVLASDEGRVPRGYGALVDEYFRRLGR